MIMKYVYILFTFFTIYSAIEVYSEVATLINPTTVSTEGGIVYLNN